MQLGDPISSRGGRRQQVSTGFPGQEREFLFKALRQLTELLKKVNCAEGFCRNSLHIPLDGPQKGQPQLGKQGTEALPGTSEAPTNTYG